MTLKSIRHLGKGGFGVVDLVSDEDGKLYARKTFSVNQPLSDDLVENVRKRFVREAQLQMGLDHRNIVPVTGSALAGEAPYYLMAVADGSLSDDLANDRTLNGRFLSALSDIVAGLEEMHNLEIFHRDLKPQNVLRYGEGDDAYYAIGDFGLISQKDSAISALTTTGMTKRSDHYTAPEITSDLRKASRQSDIYSLGCILHDMVGREERVPCAEIREDGPYEAILLNCTRKDPARRFKTVGAVLDALVSIEPEAAPVRTAAAGQFAEELDSDAVLDEDFWRALNDFLEDRAVGGDTRAILVDEI